MQFARLSVLPIALALALAACGSGDDGGPDGGLPPGTPDADPNAPDADPNAPDADPGAPDAMPVPVTVGPVLVSEIMYHPVLEQDFVERHEFIELHNPSAEDVPLDGWTLTGGIDYAFPTDAVLAAGGYIVVARDRAAFLSVYDQVDPALVYGDFVGALDNGGETVIVQAPDQSVSDAVAYDDKAPWPVAADALGAGERWLDPALLPLDTHRYRGYSLERVSADVDSIEIANWVASPLDAPTPGSANAGARQTPLVAVAARQVGPSDGSAGPIRAGGEALIQVRMSEVGAIAGARIEYFVDDVTRTDEPIQSVDMVDDGSGGDAGAGDRVYTAVLPAQAERAIVRYRVLVDDGAGEPLRAASPRATDPVRWNAYYVSPVLGGTTRAYELFIDMDRWSEMWTNVEAGRVPSNQCTPNPLWNQKVPAVFVHDGQVYDVFVRYQGSSVRRHIGAAISGWTGPAPVGPSPFVALSWRVQFPRYARLDGHRVIALNKMDEGTCPGLVAGVGMQLFAEAGLATPQVRYARLYVNGEYYRYALELERPGEDMIERWHEAEAARTGNPEYLLGHLFKSSGTSNREGPYGFGDGSELSVYCGYQPNERYAFTYDRKTHEWLGHDNLIALITGLNDARSQGNAALRAYLEANFDVDYVLTYLAIINWSVPYDDMYKNFYLYQRREDSKWMIFPWDLDRDFGDWKGERLLGPETSLYVGVEDNPDNGNGLWNVFKDSFLTTFSAEYEARLLELNDTVLAPAHVSQLVDDFFAGYSTAEANAAASPASASYCLPPQSIKDFAQARHDFVAAELAN
ncbi:CotH kinase family protein [Haliangium sp.]|uniref:CotH kinase family protein n=1 Tax=Haliangium sp. TaxID=2663208 RepID=UPI003D132825